MTTTQLTGNTRIQIRPATTRPPLLRVLGGGVVAALAGATVLFAYGAVATAVHGPMQVGDPGHSVPITASSFAIGVLFSSFFGVALAVAIARWTRRPARNFQRAAIALTVVSLWAPFTAQTDASTQVWLAAGHVIAAFVVIPLIVRSLRTRLD